MKNRTTGEKIAITIIITAVMTFLSTASYFTLYLGYRSTSKFPGSEKLFQTLDILDEKYYQDFDKKKAIDDAISAMVNSVGDPYTSYLSKEELEGLNMLITGKYSGVGLIVSADTADNKIVAVSAFDDSPAYKAGIKTGDKIIKVNGEDVFGDQLDAATAKMKGEKGTEVTLTILKKDTNETLDIKIIRNEISLKTVESKMYDSVGYIRITSFDINTDEDFKDNLKKVTESGAKSIIIDVRSNGGGLAESAYNVADSIIPKDSMVYYTVNKSGRRTEFKTKTGGIEIPVAVLVDEGTASASEILSGAIKDNGRGVLVGKKTFGKGLVQQPIPLSDGSVVKVTIERYFTPSGADINKQGILPDYEISLVSEKDEQLQKALEILANK